LGLSIAPKNKPADRSGSTGLASPEASVSPDTESGELAVERYAKA